jgi:hypothetical protein
MSRGVRSFANMTARDLASNGIFMSFGGKTMEINHPSNATIIATMQI